MTRLSACASLVIVIAFVALANAQDRDARERVQASVTFGFDNSIESDRWTAVTITVSSGETPFGGVATLTHPVGDRTTASYTVPIATTPGRETVSHIYAHFPIYCGSATLRITDARTGRAVFTQRFDQGLSRDALPMPAQSSRSQRGMLSVGDTGLARAHRVWRDTAALNDDTESEGYFGMGSRGRVFDPEDPEDLAEILNGMGFHACPPGAMPDARVGYDSFALIAVRADDADAARAALPAIHEWTRRGGVLVVIADSPGDEWQRWLAPGIADGIEFGPASRHAVPAECARAAGAAADDAPARAIACTDDSPWRLRWQLRDNSDLGLMAYRDHGFGRVVVLGVSPRRVPKTLDDKAEASLFVNIIRPPLMPILRETAFTRAGEYYVGTQGSTAAALRRVTGERAVSDGVFPWILGAGLALALLLGPIDALVLRRFHRTNRSWATALGWIALASVVAYTVPTRLRAGPTSFMQFQIADMIDGEWSSVTCHGVFAGSTRRSRYDGAPSDSWWRPVTGSTMFGRGGPSPLAQTHNLFQRPADTGKPPGSPLLERTHRIWTFSSFVSESDEPAPLNVESFTEADEGRLELVLRRDAGDITSVMLRDDFGWRVGQLQTTDDAAGLSTFVFDRVSASEPPASSGLARSAGWTPWNDETSLYTAMKLGDAEARGHAIERLIADGPVVCVYVEFDGGPATISLDEPLEASRAGVARLVLQRPGGQSQ